MRAFVFRCPVTGQQVQGLVVDDIPDEEGVYLTFACAACSGAHFVSAAPAGCWGTNQTRVETSRRKTCGRPCHGSSTASRVPPPSGAQYRASVASDGQWPLSSAT
jgi:hypothetical protein